LIINNFYASPQDKKPFLPDEDAMGNVFVFEELPTGAESSPNIIFACH